MDPDKPETHVTRAMLYTLQGKEALARKELDTIATFLRTDYALASYAAAIYAKQHNTAEALNAMETSMHLGNRWYSWYLDPWFDGIRSEPRFQTSLQALKSELDGVAGELQQRSVTH